LSPTAPPFGARGRAPTDAQALQHASIDPGLLAAKRFARVHGDLELKAALLALLLPAGSRRAERAFVLETAEVRAAAELHAHSRNLSRAARLPWLECLAARMSLHPLPVRQALLQSARRLLSARGRWEPRDRLLWMALRRGGRPVLLAMFVVIAVLMRAYGAYLLTLPWNPYLPVLWWFVVFHARTELLRRREQGLCWVCGYDIRATLARCPECGSAASAEATAA